MAAGQSASWFTPAAWQTHTHTHTHTASSPSFSFSYFLSPTLSFVRLNHTWWWDTGKKKKTSPEAFSRCSHQFDPVIHSSSPSNSKQHEGIQYGVKWWILLYITSETQTYGAADPQTNFIFISFYKTLLGNVLFKMCVLA